jgi:hypothetical protein
MGPGPRVRGWAAAFGEDEEAGPLLSAETKRRTTIDGSVLLTRRFTLSAHGGRHPRSMTCGPGPPCQRLGTSVCNEGDFPWRLGAQARESAFKKGFIPRVAAMPCFSPP